MLVLQEREEVDDGGHKRMCEHSQDGDGIVLSRERGKEQCSSSELSLWTALANPRVC